MTPADVHTFNNSAVSQIPFNTGLGLTHPIRHVCERAPKNYLLCLCLSTHALTASVRYLSRSSSSKKVNPFGASFVHELTTSMVWMTGIEPASLLIPNQAFYQTELHPEMVVPLPRLELGRINRGILNSLCLPIPPHGHI